MIVGSKSSETCEQADGDKEIVFSDSTPRTYSIRVAAVNNVGRGPFSEPFTIEVNSESQCTTAYTQASKSSTM